jgi:rare lipoprotein A (peptidoglycan hydrolase)
VSKRAARLLAFADRGTATVRVEYVGRAPIAGSDDRILEATLREHDPAPAPWNVKFASAPIVPTLPAQPPPVRTPSYASATMNDVTATAHAMSFAATPNGIDGVELISGRGLY